MALVKNTSLIKKNSKTFYLASVFLPHNAKRKVLEVYTFCRLYDDIVDLKLDNNLNFDDIAKYLKVISFGKIDILSIQ